MKDQYGRNIDYIRISVTDRCNLRCIYCMPEEGVERVSHGQILTFDEIGRLCGILAEEGLRKIKLTGGEPLVRKGITSLVRQLKAINGIEQVTITTNGVLLEAMYEELIEAGIDEITISLDTLDECLYEKITRRDMLKQVMRGIDLAVAKGKVPVKVNCVPVFGMEEQDLLSIARLAQKSSIHVRFIEMMPIGLGKNFRFVKEEELMELFTHSFGALNAFGGTLGNGPSSYYTVAGFQGKLGFISAVSHKFCGGCNRIRLTSEGYFKTCLQFDTGVDLKPLLERGCTDAELKEAMLLAVGEKPSGHHFLEEQELTCTEQRGMSQIGG